jgi:uncharacterized Ntn-hydrolase superfamily protein
VTFSLVARDPASGAFGAVLCSSSPAVAARCVHMADGAGAVLSQNVTDPRLGRKLIGLLGAGVDAATAVATVVASEPFTEFRQLVALDTEGRAAIHSGSEALGVVAAYAADGAAAAGNLLATPDVPRRLVEAWLAAEGPVETRLLAALTAAVAAGGEAGPVHSAGLSVINGSGWRVTDLRVDWSDDPLADLTALVRVWLPQRDDYITRALNPGAAPSYGVPGDDR